MKVTLTSLTQPTNGITPEESIVQIARVSNPSNENNHETAPKLISYLVANKHWSPFEMVDMCVEIETSRAIATQILRHRSFSFQEFSQRYAKVEGLEPIELRAQADKNRQSSTDVINPRIESPFDGKMVEADKVIAHLQLMAQKTYASLLNKGVAKEVARFVLPLNSQTRLYMKGSVRSWIHYLQIRADSHTQKEHREIAQAIKQIFVNQFPNISQALGFIL